MNSKLNKGGIFVPLANRGKDKKLIPWSHITKQRVYPSINHCVSEKYGIDSYLVEKTIDGKKMQRLFKTERDALKALDMFLITNGREPRHILKRT